MTPEQVSNISAELQSICIVDTSCSNPLIAVIRDGLIDIGAVFYSPANDGEILGMGVLPSYRRRGIARRLWEFVAQEADVGAADVVAEPVTNEGHALCVAMWRKL